MHYRKASKSPTSKEVPQITMFVSLLFSLVPALTASAGTAEPSTQSSFHSPPSQLAVCLEEEKLVDIHPHNSYVSLLLGFFPRRPKRTHFFPMACQPTLLQPHRYFLFYSSLNFCEPATAKAQHSPERNQLTGGKHSSFSSSP